MSDNNRQNFNSYVYIPLVLTFVFLLGCFIVALSTISEETVQGYIVDNVSSFDLSRERNVHSYMETQDENGIKYYIIDPSEEYVNIASNNAYSSVEDGLSSTNGNVVSSKPATEEKVAYLTFDDGPSENTEKILDILDEYNVKATFFVIYHKNMDSKYKEIVDRGHTIALHSYTHNYKKIYASEEAYFSDLEKLGDFVESVTGVKSNIIRFPGGSSNTISNKYSVGIMQKLKKDVIEKGYSYHDWNVDSGDASGNNVEKEVLVENVKASLTKYREVNILMHDTGETKKTTVEALPSIIEYVQSQGYYIERITEDTRPIRHG